MTKLPQWQQLLAERGILKAALDARWQPSAYHGRPAWLYPLFNLDGTETGICRYKLFSATDGDKYRWSDREEGQTLPVYYLLPGLVEAIDKANGRLIIASGEPDNLAYRSAGSNNVLSFFGEGNCPMDIQTHLIELGVRSLELYPDLDKAGYTWAATIRERCPDFEVHVYKLPGEYGSKFDINKLWMDVRFDYHRFWDTLDKCPKLDVSEFTAPQLPRQKKFHSESSSLTDDLPIPQEALDEIALRLGVVRYKANGYSENVRCPFHDDSKPSAGWHRDKHILKCMVCHGENDHALAKEVADVLGIDYRANLNGSGAKAKVLRNAPRQSSSPRKEVYSYSEGSDAARKQLFEETRPVPALPIPWKNVAKFNGFARLVQARKMIAIAGDSGDGKTAAMETISDSWRRLDFSGWVWSPEWSVEELVYRTVQRMGGPALSQIEQHLTWKALHAKGVHPDSNYGVQLDDTSLALWRKIDDKIRQWAGKVYFIDKPGTTIDNLYSRVTELVNDCKAQGITIAWGLADYMQLLDSDGNGENERVKRSLAGLKNMTNEHNMVTLVGSQITKSDGRAALSGAKSGKHAMQYARSDVFNLQLTFSRELDSKGDKTNFAKVSISKNNLGSEGVTALELDTTLMIWKDCQYERRNLNDDLENQPAPLHLSDRPF